MNYRSSRTKKMDQHRMTDDKTSVKEDRWGMTAQEALRVNYVSSSLREPNPSGSSR